MYTSTCNTKNKIKLTFIRHGKTRSNIEQKYLGWKDEPLAPEGAEELRKIKADGVYDMPGILFVSPMKRCLETAGILFPGADYIVVPEWKEIDFGDFSGKTHGDLKDDPYYRRWLESGGKTAFPGGESREAFTRRVMSGYERVREMLLGVKTPAPESTRDPGEAAYSAAAVVHGGTIMTLMSELCGGEYFSYMPQNGRGYTVLV